MVDALYRWIQNITAYLVVAAAVIHALPGREYEKYVRFFTGLVLIMLVFTPVLKLTGAEERFMDIYYNELHNIEEREIEQAAAWMTDESFLDFLPEEYIEPETEAEKEKEIIEVEEIRIGE